MNFPKCTRIQIEVTNICNYNCSMCQRLKLNVPQKHMALSVYKKVLKNCIPIKDIDLTGWGEPLIHPDILTMIKLAAETGARVSFTTNASLLIKQKVADLNQSGLNQLAISIDSFKSDSAGHSQKIIENNLLLIKKDSRKFNLKIQATLIGQDIAELNNIATLAHKLGADEFRLMRCDGRYHPVKLDRAEEKKIFNSLSKKWRGKLNVTMAQYKISSGLHHYAYRAYRSLMPRHCLKFLTSAYINVDGFLSQCCMLTTCKSCQIGDIKKTPLQELWRSQEFRQFRRKSCAICRNCAVLIK